jgi:hypothetical protein
MLSLKINALTKPTYTKLDSRLNSNKLEWNVFREDFNQREIVVYNIFQHAAFYDAVKQIAKKRPDKETFANKVRIELSYYFWSKSEHEVIVTSWPAYIDRAELCRLKDTYEATKDQPTPYKINISPVVGEKIDIYTQVIMNWDQFIDYSYKFFVENLPTVTRRVKKDE